jgi:tyrosine-protein phosphatase YwqE
MFHIFSRKYFIADYLNNFVDIHNHILPGIDDGAKTPAESIALIRSFMDMGVTAFIATPHIMHNYYPNTPQTINSSLVVLRDELLKNDLKNISIEAAAEHMIDDNFEALVEEDQVMPMKNGYLLVEMSYLQPPINFKEAIIKTASKRYFPILAHPERYGFLHQGMKKYHKFKEQGIHFQLNLLSLSDFYGEETMKMAAKLLDEGLIDFVASDVHNPEQLNVLKEISIPKKLVNQLLPVIRNTIETFY